MIFDISGKTERYKVKIIARDNVNEYEEYKICVTDKRLIKNYGGIIAGMSGSLIEKKVTNRSIT